MIFYWVWNLLQSGEMLLDPLICAMLSLLTFLLSLSAFAQEPKVLRLPDFSQVYTLSSMTANKEQPTFIFLPGIYRGFLGQEKFLNILTARKMNWVVMHFSRHPESVIAGTPVFTSMVSSQQLAYEVSQVRKAYRIKRPIVVSLSFSSSVIPYLNPKEFPVVVETAPMGRADENLPPQQAGQQWESFMSSVPGGSFVVSSAHYWGYRYFWSKQVQGLLETYPHYRPFQFLIAEGLAQLAFSSRHFDLRNQNFQQGPQRYWILGQKEDAQRGAIQMAAIQLYQSQRTREKNSVFIIPKAGHIVPAEQPENYAKILISISKAVARQQ